MARICLCLAILIVAPAPAHAWVGFGLQGGAERVRSNESFSQSERRQAEDVGNLDEWSKRSFLGSEVGGFAFVSPFSRLLVSAGGYYSYSLLRGKIASEKQFLRLAEYGFQGKFGVSLGRWNLFLEVRKAVGGRFRYESRRNDSFSKDNSRLEVYSGALHSQRIGVGLEFRLIRAVRLGFLTERGLLQFDLDEIYEVDLGDGAPYLVTVPDLYRSRTMSSETFLSSIILEL